MIQGILFWSGPFFLLTIQTAGLQTLDHFFPVKTLHQAFFFVYITSAYEFCIFHYLIDSGSLEFVVPPADSSVFFPISVRFSATNTFSDLKVCYSYFDILLSIALAVPF